MITLIAGMGMSGQACAAFLQHQGRAFETFDDRRSASEVQAALGTSVTHHVGVPELSGYSHVVVSPGIAMTHPIVTGAKAADVPILSEIELAFRESSGRIIAVTGSNGKSTTASLIHHLLDSAGKPSVLCGNIGVPFIQVVDKDPNKIYVLEVSSFQLEHVHYFRPHTGILLNISPDHLDRHGTIEAYERAKLRLFARQESEDLALSHPDYLDRVPGRAKKHAVPGPHYHLQTKRLMAGTGNIISTDKMPLIGVHNRTNALFACAAAIQEEVAPHRIDEALPSFRGLEHRMEAVGTHEGILWINDSKATNTHATQAAIEAMEQPYVLILGGCDKGERFKHLNFASRPPRAVVAYGETAPLILEDLAPIQPIHEHEFASACQRALACAQPGDAVLLAPACASFDQFSSYGERGKTFKELFNGLTS